MKKFFSLFAAVLFAGSMMATTYGAVKASEVKAGELYVFVQTCDEATTAMSNSIANGKAAVTADFLKTGFAGDEAYVWTVEAAEGGWNIKSASDNKYLNNTNKGNLTADAAASSVWDIAISGDFALITNTGNSRFLGLNDVRDSYKTYAAENMANYPHDIVIWKLVEGGEGSIEATEGGSGEGGGDVDVTFTSIEASNYYDYFSDEGEDITIYLYNEDEDAYLQLDIIVPAGTGEGAEVLPAGTYEITDTYALNTAVVGDVDDEYYPIGCWYIVSEEEAYDLVSGTVVITKSGSTYTITVNAEDFEGNTYKATYTGAVVVEEGQFEGIEDIVLTEKAQKVSVDGTVYVIRDNKMYNVTGTRVR